MALTGSVAPLLVQPVDDLLGLLPDPLGQCIFIGEPAESLKKIYRSGGGRRKPGCPSR